MKTSGDTLLKKLSEAQGVVSEYVSRFISSEDLETAKIVDDWFALRTQLFFDQPLHSEDVSADLSTLEMEERVTNPKKVKLLSLHPNFFRGFRKLDSSINLQGSLVVLDGRNSSGKTSLAEAIEWLLIGHVCRRDTGDPKELAECIANRFRPEDEETWVELIFELDGERYVVRRTLLKDYDSKRNSTCDSRLEVNSVEQDQALDYLVDYLFSGVAPLLMQHTLRLFVLDSPDQRRDYFERLLSLDRITSLIEKSVVGDARLSDFPNESGSTMLAEWNSLKDATTNRTMFRRVEGADESQMRNLLEEALFRFAVDEFKTEPQLTFSQLVESIQSIQRQVRQANFPLLESFRPKRTLDEALFAQLESGRFVLLVNRLEVARNDFATAQVAANTIAESQLAVSRALQSLRDVGLILEDVENQYCPLCEFQEVPTLSAKRIGEISAWDPIRTAFSSAKQTYIAVLEETVRAVRELRSSRFDLLPASFSEQEWLSAEAITGPVILAQIKDYLSEVDDNLRQFDALTEMYLESSLTPEEIVFDPLRILRDISKFLPQIIEYARIYTGRFSSFENHIGVIAGQDKQYSVRENWLSIAEKLEVLMTDLRWEAAKRKAQKELSDIRDILISVRQQYLESRRIDFSNGISEVWNKLRADRYSTFGKLFIPEPRGKGFPVKIEVKAVLDSGTEQREVDALAVFSESQINAVGIAAFITRSRLVGHSCLVLDDPVQSMDEEHFKTFASTLLSHLCDEGFQVILLTHSDTFAREISYAHSHRPDYVTMKVEPSRRKGCQVKEGNRRVVERLDQAMRYAEDGDLQQAWLHVRFAIERLYTVVQITHGPKNFTPSSWANHTAENMWNESIESIFTQRVPDSVTRIREITAMTAAGAHDKSPYGLTDLTNAIKDMKPLLNRLGIGG